MDKPDLLGMGHDLTDLIERLYAFGGRLEEATDAAVGEWDTATDSAVPDTGSGDDARLLQEAIDATNQAAKALLGCRQTLATVQGYRVFSDSEAVTS